MNDRIGPLCKGSFALVADRCKVQLTQRAIGLLQVAAKKWKNFYLTTVYCRSQQICIVVWTSLKACAQSVKIKGFFRNLSLFVWVFKLIYPYERLLVCVFGIYIAGCAFESRLLLQHTYVSKYGLELRSVKYENIRVFYSKISKLEGELIIIKVTR